MRVVVADTFEKSGLDRLRALGCDVMYAPELEGAALTDALGRHGADALVVRSTAVRADMLEAGPLALIVRAGAGFNTIDVQAASRRGVYVATCPGRNAVAVAELTLGLILALDRRIPDNVAALRGGRWNKKEFARARGLAGSTLGLLGVGSIAREVIRRAVSFDLRIAVWSRRFDREARLLTSAEAAELGIADAHAESPIALAPSAEVLASRSDILSVHLALTPDTKGIVDGRVIGALRSGACLINTSRGELVDHEALADAVASRGIRAGLDVFAHEPAGSTGEFNDPIVSLDGVYGTHHIGASTDQAQEAIAAETVRIVRAYKETGKVPNVVNLCARTPATHRLIVRHLDRPGVLAHVFDCLRERQINVQETENIVFAGAEAAIARINLDGAPDQALLAHIRSGNADIIDLQVVAL